MSTLSLAKLKAYLPFAGSENYSSTRHSKTTRLLDTLDPEVGFQLVLVPKPEPSTGSEKHVHCVPELHVTIVGARHLPSLFGLKTVQGYVIKIKLFPGSLRYDTTIQTSSWPTFNETFKFPLEATTKSSFKSKTKHDPAVPSSSVPLTLPEKLFKGNFLVLTVFALLELPAGSRSSIKDRIQQIRRKSNMLRLKEKQASSDVDAPPVNDDIMKLTTSETRRNIGSVTCFLDPKLFDENHRTGNFATDEIWLPIKDITVTPSTSSNVSVTTCTKGQIEMILQICNDEPPPESTDDLSPTKRPSQISKEDNTTVSETKIRWTDVKKRLTGSSKRDKYKGLCLKIITSKMRCSIKVKEEFESVEGLIYVKTTVFEHDILSSTWKSDQFSPSLSIRWNPDNSTITIPLNDESDLDNVSVKITVATKTKLGKKIVLGTLYLGSKTKNLKLEHWENMVANRGNAVSMWHAFE